MSSPPSGPRAAAIQIVDTLQRSGHVAYFAGGCVRDEIMGITPKDYDVATSAHPEEVASLFRRTQSVGEHFGVMLVLIKGITVEVATFRAEWGYSDNRRPDRVQFTDAEHDAQRRDFTINGLFMDPNDGDRVIDFVGGCDDIKAGIVRAIGNADDRLDEDHLRALRAVRFAARFSFAIEPRTVAAIRADASSLRGVSRERIGHEIRFMLADPGRGDAARIIHELGLDAPVFNEPPQPDTTPKIVSQLPASMEVAASLAAWALDRAMSDDETVVRWRKSLALSNRETGLFRATLRELADVRESWTLRSVSQRKRLAASTAFGGVMEITKIVDPSLASTVQADLASLAAHAGGIAPEPFITGEELISAGLTPGPSFKGILEQVYDAQLEGKITDAQAALDLAIRLSKE